MTAPDAYWEEARAALHHCAAEDARVWAGPEPGLQPALEALDPGRYEPEQPDLGICDDPEVTWPAEPAREALERQIAGSDREAGLGHDYDGPSSGQAPRSTRRCTPSIRPGSLSPSRRRSRDRALRP